MEYRDPSYYSQRFYTPQMTATRQHVPTAWEVIGERSAEAGVGLMAGIVEEVDPGAAPGLTITKNTINKNMRDQLSYTEYYQTTGAPQQMGVVTRRPTYWERVDLQQQYSPD